MIKKPFLTQAAGQWLTSQKTFFQPTGWEEHVLKNKDGITVILSGNLWKLNLLFNIDQKWS